MQAVTLRNPFVYTLEIQIIGLSDIRHPGRDGQWEPGSKVQFRLTKKFEGSEHVTFVT